MTTRELFRKGQSSSSPVRTPDTLLSNDTLETLVAISEGPIKGPIDGPKSVMLDDTSLVNAGTGKPNFKNFSLDFYPGNPLGDEITMKLGGFSNPINIGVELVKGTPVVRQGVQTQVDAFDFRFVVSALYRSTDKGTFTNKLTLKLEYKKRSAAEWTPAWIASEGTAIYPTVPGGGPTNPSTGEYTSYVVNGLSLETLTFEGDEVDLIQSDGVPTGEPETDTALAVDVNTGSYYHWDSDGNSWELATTTPIDEESDQVTTPTRSKKVFRTNKYPTGPFVVGDIWWMPGDGLFGQFYVWNGTTWAERKKKETPPPAGDGIWSINAKASSATPKDIRVILPEPSDEPLDWRVTKLSDDSDTTHFSVVAWESVQEIKRSPFTFYDLAMIHLVGQASDQFTSMPNINGVYEGRMVKVPSNYDEVARTYDGIWDGTYKIAYTNNTAFIFQDFVENTTYGLSKMYPHTVNKWKIYEWGQYCDEPVQNADGSFRPRWTYNDYITEPRDAKEAAQFIAGTASARYYDDGNGFVDIIIDRDDPAVALFTLENVGEDGFSYSYTDRQTRANFVIVKFINPDLNWQEDTRYVSDPEDIAEYGLFEETFVAVGAIDLEEAEARARRRLISGLTEKEFVTFTTNRKGRFLSEWDIILVADPDMGRGLSGRIQAQTASNAVSLRDPISLEPGFTYYATFETPNPNYSDDDPKPFVTTRLQITNSPATHTSLTFAADLPAGLPEYAAFAVDAEDVIGLPKPYRVLNIEDDSGSGEFIKITALELNRAKFLFTDTAQESAAPRYTAFTREVQPASNPRVSTFSEMVGPVARRRLRLNWDRSTSPWVKRYDVQHLIDSTFVNAFRPDVTSIEVDATVGLHRFIITAINSDERRSLPIEFEYEVIGGVRQPDPVVDLRLVGGASETTFDTHNPQFEWSPPTTMDPHFSTYRLRVVRYGDTVRQVDLGSQLRWRYNLDQHLTDGLLRELNIEVVVVDQYGNESLPAELTVTNPPPVVTAVTEAVSFGGVTLSPSGSLETDVTRIVVWASRNTGFTTSPATEIYRGAIPATISGLTPGAEYFYRYAFDDEFGDADLNISSEGSFTTLLVERAGIDAEVTDQIDDNSWAILRDVLDRADKSAADLTVNYIGTKPAAPVLNEMIVEETAARIAAVAQEAQDRIDGITAEANARAAAILAEAATREAAITAEATTRQTEDESLASDIQTVSAALDDETDARVAAIQAEQTARATAISAEAASRETLATQVRGNYTGNDITAVTSGLFYQERVARSNADDSLAQQITLLSAGAGEQFDPLSIWYFDSGVESWTGNGTPTATSGWLKAANHASDAYVISPDLIGAPSSTYSQVRLRIRKVGTPTWEGYLWWQRDVDSTWDAARRVSLTEPTYDANNIGLISVTPEWTGMIDQVRLDLSTGQDSSNYYEIDWVAIGRPSPGASTAALALEQTARASGDSAEVTARETLATKVLGTSDPTGLTLGGLSSGLIYDERTARTTAVSNEVTAREMLATKVLGATDPTGLTLGGLSSGLIYDERTARTSADSANASRIDVLFVSTTTSVVYNLDPTHQNWPVANALPTNVVTSGTAPTTTRLTSNLIYGEKALKGAGTAVASTGYQRQAAAMKPASAPASGYVVCEWEVTLDAGDFKRSGFEFRLNFASGYKSATVHLFDEHASPTVGKTYRGSKLVALADVGSSGAVVDQTDFLWLNNSTVFTSQSNSAKTITFHRVAWREATPAEYAAGVTLSAGLTAETTARTNADNAEITARETLATKVLGTSDPTGLTLGGLSSGLIYDERTARSNADATEVAARQALSVKILGANDPAGLTLSSLSSGLIYDERTARVAATDAISVTVSGLSATVDSHTASIASEASTRASADATAAARIDTLFASNAGIGFVHDPTHQNWPVANALPTNVVTSGTAPTTTRITSGLIYGEKALKGAGTAVTSTGYQRQAAGMKPAALPATGYVVCEWEVTLDAGDFKRSGFEFRLNYTTGYKSASVHLFDQHTSPVAGKTYRGSKLVQLIDQSPTGSVVDQTDFLWLNNSTVFTSQSNSAKTITFHRVTWREATAEEVAAGVTLPTISASVSAETIARQNADTAEAAARQLISTTTLGVADPTGLTLASLASGLLYDERTARTTADSSAASRIDLLYVSAPVGNGYSLDPTHQSWPTANALPTNVVTSGTAPTTTRITSGLIYGEKALKGAGTAVASTGYQRQAASMKPAVASASGYLVCEYEVTLDSGDFKRAGFEYRINYTSGYKRGLVHLFDQHASPTTGRLYRGSKLVQLTDVASSGSIIDQTDYLWLNNSTVFTSQTNSAKTITFHRVNWREATAEEVAAGVTLYNTLSAMITDEANARVSGDSANASSISTLNTTVAGHTTTITTHTSALTDINGRMAATWGVTQDVNGRVSGVKLMTEGGGGTTKSTFDITADKFRIYDPDNVVNTDRPVFSVVDGRVYLGENLLISEAIKAGAAVKITSDQSFTSTTAPSRGNPSGHALVKSMTFEVDRADSKFTVVVSFIYRSNNNNETYCWLKIGQTAPVWAGSGSADMTNVDKEFSCTGYDGPATAVFIFSGLPVGTNTVELHVGSTGSGSHTNTCNDPIFIITEDKRPA